MSQNIKNTLYRFVTMRNPEQIDDQQKENYFVQKPEDVTSEFDGLTLNSEAFINKAKAYESSYKSIQDLKDEYNADGNTLYTFAIWFTKNRTSVTQGKAIAKLGSVNTQSLTNNQLTKLWNDLVYYSFVQNNAKVRDAIISILVANFYITKIGTRKINYSDDYVQRIAQARVILNIQRGEEPGNSNEPITSSISYEEEEKEHNYIQAFLNIKDLTAAKEELKVEEDRFTRAEDKRKKTANVNFEEATEKAYAEATLVERVVTDPKTGETAIIKEYEGLNLPKYKDFYTEVEDQLSQYSIIHKRVEPTIIEGSFSLIESIVKNKGFSKFSEVFKYVDNELEKENRILLENEVEQEKTVLYQGVSIPVKSSLANYGKGVKVCLMPHSRGGGYYYVNISFGGNSSVNDFSSANYTINIDGRELTGTTLSSPSIGGLNTAVMQLFNGAILMGSSPKNISLDATITKNTGEIITFSISGIALLDKVNKGCKTFPIKIDNPNLGGGSSTEPIEPETHGLTRLGIADYRKVEQEVCCYVPGEVSHIENVMAREYKSRSNTRRKLSEVNETTSSESETEKLTDTTSTDRFEMNQEIASLSATDTSFGLQTHSNFEAFKGAQFSIGTSFATNTSKEESNSQAITHAKEMTERALDRVVQKIRQERVEKIVEEYTEENTHGFDNRKGDSHVSGVYRWIDKVYKNQIHNYGKRLMYEFMIPEPASFHLEAAKLAVKNNSGSLLTKPKDPRKSSTYKLLGLKSINKTSANYWAGVFNAEIDAEPEKYKSISKSFSFTTPDGHWNELAEGSAEIEAPDGYRAIYGKGSLFINEGDGGGANITIADKSKRGYGAHAAHILYTSLDLGSTSVPVSYSSLGSHTGNVNFIIKCIRTDALYEQWQIDTFNAIITAYEKAKAKYDEQANPKVETGNVKINPNFYRRIENQVLRKNCMAYLLGNENLGKDFIISRGNTTAITPKQNDGLDAYTAKVKFFEQAFEWDIMSYNFYPFYWADKNEWVNKYQVENDDPLFRAFLQSGMARVVVTVRPGFEEAVNWYLATGQIWNGGQVPVIDDDNFVSIVEELQNPEYTLEETWETRVPTSLTVIQAGSIGLNVEGLPCNPDCEDNLQFASDKNPIQQSTALIGEEKDPYEDCEIVTSYHWYLNGSSWYRVGIDNLLCPIK